jgi:hypothetical protein
MKEFALLFRRPNFDFSKISPKEMEALAKKWQDWMGGIAAQGKLVGKPVRLAPEGKVLKPAGVTTDGPFVEMREILGGLIIVKADSAEEAITLSHGCPALEIEGSVEVRAIMSNG